MNKLEEILSRHEPKGTLVQDPRFALFNYIIGTMLCFIVCVFVGRCTPPRKQAAPKNHEILFKAVFNDPGHKGGAGGSHY